MITATTTPKNVSETDIINLLECLIDNVFAMFGWRVFQQTIGIPMGTISNVSAETLTIVRGDVTLGD
jgi:hypothetical protein